MASIEFGGLRQKSLEWDRARVANFFLQFGLIWVFILLLIASAVIYPGLFQFANIRNIVSQSAPVGIAAVGMTFVIISGGFDFSVGSIVALSAVVFANRADVTGLWGAAAIVMLCSFICGTINGVIVTRLKVNPFVATLGSGSMFGGAAYIFSNNAPQTPNNPGFQYLGTQAWLGWPIASWILFVALLVGGFVLARTVYGRSIYAIGGNSEAARLSGLRVDLLRGSTYVISALCAGLAGLILTSRLGLGQADMGGTMSLDAIAIVVVGGTSLLGGEGKMWRTAIGLLILSTLTYLFDSLAVSTSYQLVVKGAIVVAAVALDVFARSRRT
jgi:ribose transport system permease protein